MNQSTSTNKIALGIGSAVVIIGVIVFLVMMNRPSGSAGPPTGITTLPNIVTSAPGPVPGIGAPAGNGSAGSQVPPTIPWKSQAGQ